MWICTECGNRYGEPRTPVSTYHMDYCDWCGEWKMVTEDRDFGYPEKQ